MRLILGVDPGATGAIAGLDPDDPDTLHYAEDMPMAGGQIAVPLLRVLVDRIGPENVAAVVVEAVHSMPKQGVASSFKFGQNYGTLLGYFGALFPVVHVPPTVWKTVLHLNGKDKDVARARAIERWPHQAHLLARKKDIGRADAALIALWHAETLRTPTPTPQREAAL